MPEQLTLQQRLRTAAQLMATSGPLRSGEAWWMARATTSLPVPFFFSPRSARWLSSRPHGDQVKNRVHGGLLLGCSGRIRPCSCARRAATSSCRSARAGTLGIRRRCIQCHGLGGSRPPEGMAWTAIDAAIPARDDHGNGQLAALTSAISSMPPAGHAKSVRTMHKPFAQGLQPLCCRCRPYRRPPKIGPTVC